MPQRIETRKVFSDKQGDKGEDKREVERRIARRKIRGSAGSIRKSKKK